jgi:hypothetical protein
MLKNKQAAGSSWAGGREKAAFKTTSTYDDAQLFNALKEDQKAIAAATRANRQPSNASDAHGFTADHA